jgi:hypothetical protein
MVGILEIFGEHKGSNGENLSDIENYYRDPFTALRAEDEILQHLPYISYDRCVECIILAVKFGLTLHTP